MTKVTTITAPFTEEQVKALNGWQKNGMTHPFTCPTHSTEPLTAKTDGWHCEAHGCGYTQDWAHDFMAKSKYCTKESPRVASSADPRDHWIHVDAEETNPEWEGEVVAYHCPNCGLDFSVDYT
jgi:hypothetical protein